MAGLVPAIHVLGPGRFKDVDPRNKSGDDVVLGTAFKVQRVVDYFAGSA
jgi:hypothetical protein